MCCYTGKIIEHGNHRAHFEPSPNGKYAELRQKQAEQLQKLEAAKKYRRENPSTWRRDRDLNILLSKH